MKQRFLWFQIIGFFVVNLLGSFLHFLYDITGQSPLVAPFSANNESTFEHMKILFFPLLLWTLVEAFVVGDRVRHFWCRKTVGTLLGVSFIPISFYTLNGMFGQTSALVNILLFLASTAVALTAEYYGFPRFLLRKTNPLFCLFLLGLLTVLFVVFTFFPPAFPLFTDPTL